MIYDHEQRKDVSTSKTHQVLAFIEGTYMYFWSEDNMNKKNIPNSKLGNFGFLLDFEQDILFQFAQLAESNLYTNKRMCAIFIRQLVECFYDEILKKESSNTEGNRWIEEYKEQYERNNGKGEYFFSTIAGKEKLLIEYFNDPDWKESRKFGKNIFQKANGSKHSDIDFPFQVPAPGKNTDKEIMMDVWPFLRKLGNEGSHPKAIPGHGWLQERFLVIALRQIHCRLKKYFYTIKKVTEDIGQYSQEKVSRASNVILYADASQEEKHYDYGGEIPPYTENRYYTIVPQIKGKRWINHIEQYVISRKYHITDKAIEQKFVLHGQSIYMLLRQHRKLDGIAKYSVLTDLRNGEDYYITAYAFPDEPNDIRLEDMIKKGAITCREDLIFFIRDIMRIIASMCEVRVYHRSISSKSIKWCVNNNPEHKFDIYIIDLEVCKSYDNVLETNATQYIAANRINEIQGKLLRSEFSNQTEEAVYLQTVTEHIKQICIELLLGEGFRNDINCREDLMDTLEKQENNIMIEKGIMTANEIKDMVMKIASIKKIYEYKQII